MAKPEYRCLGVCALVLRTVIQYHDLKITSDSNRCTVLPYSREQQHVDRRRGQHQQQHHVHGSALNDDAETTCQLRGKLAGTGPRRVLSPYYDERDRRH